MSRTNPASRRNVLFISSAVMNSGGPSFPAELWEHTFSYLTRRELVHVARVCRQLAAVGRSCLYRNIDLRDDDPNIQATVDLLRGNRNLGLKIRSATLTTSRQWVGHRPWIDPDIFQHWTMLHSLVLRGFPFTTRYQKEVFRNSIHQFCKDLVSVTFKPVVNLELVGLPMISWTVRPDLEVKLNPATIYSIQSLTHICWTNTIVHHTVEQYDEILGQRFPNLISLELGSLCTSPNAVSLNERITMFIRDHPSIEHLSLGKEKPSSMSFQLDRNHLNPGSLPSMRSFEGFPENIIVMAQAGVSSLYRLSTLSLFSNHEDLSDIERMFDVLGQDTVFPLVTELRVELYPKELNHRMESNVTYLPHRRWMYEFGSLCPAVTNLSARLPPLHSKTLASMFEGYHELETISLPKVSLTIHMPPSRQAQLDFFAPIAGRCRKLRQIIARKPDYSRAADSVYTLRRDPRTAALTAVVIEVIRE